MTSNEVAILHLLIQELESCAAAYAYCAENLAGPKAANFEEYSKRLLTAAECFKMDLLEEELMDRPSPRKEGSR